MEKTRTDKNSSVHFWSRTVGPGQLSQTGVAVEKLFLAKFAKMKLRQDAL